MTLQSGTSKFSKRNFVHTMITNVSTCKHANLDCPGLFPSCNTEEECSSMLQAVHSTGDSAQSPLAPDVVPDCLLNAKALERFVSSKEVHAWFTIHTIHPSKLVHVPLSLSLPPLVF